MKPTATPGGEVTRSPRDVAIAAYNTGIAERDRAWKLEAAPDAATPEAQKKAETKQRKAYERARAYFKDAVDADPTFHPALASLGYTERQLGNYDKALEYYDKALAIQPTYVEAIEYRAEAYLGLDRTEDAMREWESLQSKDAKLAAELAQAFKSWVAKRREDPRGIDVGELDKIERWADERLDGQAVSSSLHKGRSW
jgi:tetratricopeptide (TPR) repeat protein